MIKNKNNSATFLNKAEKDYFRTRLENFFVKNPKIKQCEAVGQGIARQTVSSALNRRKNSQSILEENRLMEVAYEGKFKETRKE